MSTYSPHSPCVTPDGQELLVGLLASGGDDESTEGRLLGLEPLKPTDFTLARDETWWAGVGAGVLAPCLEEHDWAVLPGASAGKERVRGYVVEVRRGRQSYRLQFATQTLSPAARRAALRLREQEALGPDEDYSFFLTTRAADEASLPPRDDDGLHASPLSDPLQFDSDSLADWLARSQVYLGPERPAGPCPADKAPPESMEVFFPREIWDEARELSRLGGENESAAVLLGRLVRDTASPAVFLVLTECLRAEHAVEEKLSVGFTGETWAVVRERLEQRRRKLNRPSERIVATAHGHNWLPAADSSGRRTCEACTVLEVCSRSTCHASQDDQQFHQSVFTGAPWALLLLWGWNAREIEEYRCYGLKNATLTPRSIRIVEK